MGFQLAITVAYELVSQITYLNAILEFRHPQTYSNKTLSVNLLDKLESMSEIKFNKNTLTKT